jgi:hypothetical protein
LLQRLVHSHKIRSASIIDRNFGRIFQTDEDYGPASLIGVLPASVIDQDAPHHTRGNCEKMHAILPLRLVLPAEPKIHLVDQRCALQTMSAALTREMIMSQAAQLFVNDGQKLIQRRRVAAAPSAEQLSYSRSKFRHGLACLSIVSTASREKFAPSYQFTVEVALSGVKGEETMIVDTMNLPKVSAAGLRSKQGSARDLGTGGECAVWFRRTI